MCWVLKAPPGGFYGSLSGWHERFPSYLVALSVLAAGLALIAGAAFRTSMPWIALSAAAAAIGTRTLISDPSFQIGLDPFRSLLDQSTLGAAFICLGCALSNPRGVQSPRSRLWIGLGLALLVTLLSLASFGLYSSQPALDLAGLGLPWLGLAFLAWALHQDRGGRTGDGFLPGLLKGASLGVLILTSTVAAVAASGLAWGLWVPGLEIAYGLGVLTLLGGLAVAATALSVWEFWKWLRDRPSLSRIIQEQQAQLEATALTLQQQVRLAATLEERQRLSRDMHDGIGGQMMSLLARVRSRGITPEELENELTGGLTELRLMVDSLDASGGSLADALAVLRSRIRTQSEAAGLGLNWIQAEDLNDLRADPNWSLNLNRLIQEAVTNAIRHSRGDRLDVTFVVVDDQTLSIAIQDNGIGFDRSQVRAGRGLANLTVRAAQLNGELEFGSTETGGGAIVRAIIPLPKPQPSAPALGDHSVVDMIPN